MNFGYGYEQDPQVLLKLLFKGLRDFIAAKLRYDPHEKVITGGRDMGHLQGLLGIVSLTALAWLVGERRSLGAWRVAATGLAVKIVLALAFLKLPSPIVGFLM